jgi:hypothetical protein
MNQAAVDMAALIGVAIPLHSTCDKLHLKAATRSYLTAHLLVVEENQNIAEIKKNSAFHAFKDSLFSLKKISIFLFTSCGAGSSKEYLTEGGQWS